tara:strand:+ start:775 stop:1863 length:1089 start_codon:yes stop_codon:yes gene_type:complete
VANVLILEPWYRGSHKSWVQGWKAQSQHSISITDGSDTGWRRSLITAPSLFAAELDRNAQNIDALIASTPIDLATVFGLLDRSTPRPPTLLYMHESQIGYPSGPKGGQAYRAIIADWASIMSADRVAVASRFHAELLLQELPTFVDKIIKGGGVKLEAALNNIQVLPVGIEVPATPKASANGCLKVLWNHRWSHDKRPDEFVHAMQKLASEGFEFEIFALGHVERSGRKAHTRLKACLGDRLAICGPRSRGEYLQALQKTDLVVSTAHHDFFGVAISEAIAAGARPVLPKRLAYPELVPSELHSELLYEGSLEDALRSQLVLDRSELHAHRAATREHVSSFDWRNVAPRYDSFIDEMITSFR